MGVGGLNKTTDRPQQIKSIKEQQRGTILFLGKQKWCILHEETRQCILHPNTLLHWKGGTKTLTREQYCRQRQKECWVDAKNAKGTQVEWSPKHSRKWNMVRLVVQKCMSSPLAAGFEKVIGVRKIRACYGAPKFQYLDTSRVVFVSKATWIRRQARRLAWRT